MISVLINKEKFNIPTSWSDVMYSQWTKIQNETDEIKILSIITNIPTGLLTNFNQGQLEKIGVLLSFLQTPLDFKSIGKPTKPINIKMATWGQRIEAEQLLRNKSDDIDGIVKCYKLEDMPIIEMFEMVLDIIEQLKIIIETEAKELSLPPTREQTMAGASMYEEFGVMNTIRAVAQGNILNFDKVLEIEYNVVFIYLKMAKTDSIFQTNYQKVLNKK